MARHSQLQREVLSLYKQCLRAAQGKPGFAPRVREEFRRNAALPASDVLRIEHLLRRGQRQLEQLRDALVLDLWPAGHVQPTAPFAHPTG
ncbi:succinate dehydrogenase assembly factor 1, mitochondrial [Alligator sinensis]|uniref:Succinate dehydrogenase assembly factor 1, mitochondrial n=1 Tax=Alligator sinensis TaxID=38654 RepID=A0A1U8DEE3_ALLSI|nr:succinate dehydrogenase assembly factor 1, mitochondrial [Alligator sinensis]